MLFNRNSYKQTPYVYESIFTYKRYTKPVFFWVYRFHLNVFASENLRHNTKKSQCNKPFAFPFKMIRLLVLIGLGS